MKNTILSLLILLACINLHFSSPLGQPEHSRGYRLDLVSALEKVFPERECSGTTLQAKLSLARNESESFQIVIQAPWDDIEIQDLRFSALRGPNGQNLPPETLSWKRVGYVRTSITPVYSVDRTGLFPDPLLPAGPFTVKKGSSVSLWVNLQTKAESIAGTYRGELAIIPVDEEPSTIALTVKVWDFPLSDETHLRTLTWLGKNSIKSFYKLGNSPQDRILINQYLARYEDILLQHRLGPGGSVADGLRREKETGQFDFTEIDSHLERLLSKGMNVFIMGTAPNLKRQGKAHYTSEFIAEFTDRLKTFGDHLRGRDWIDRAYVYVYDEAPEAAWPEVKKISKAIRSAAPELRIIQCLNEPSGVKALQGYVDVFDVYITQYHQTGMAQLQREGTEAWLAVCCCPADHPNLFIEYPLIDARIIPMFCWKYGVQGFEYWSPNHWNRNAEGRERRWPEVPWDPNSFGKYNGDGYLLYPGPDGEPYPSIRLKALRDGFEDYEYMWRLSQLVKTVQGSDQPSAPLLKESKRLLGMNEVISDDGDFVTQEVRYFSFRQKVAESIIALQTMLE